MAVKPRAPKMTRKEFLRSKPVNPVGGRTGGQRYQSYLTAYQRKYGPTRRQSAQGPVPSIESLLGQVGRFETPAQLEARANRMAGQGIKSQQAIIREEAKLLRDEAQRRMESQAAAGRAAAAQNAGLFGMVGGEYNAGAQEIRNLGTNLMNQSQVTSEGQQLAQNAGLSQVGAPAMAVGGPAGANTLAGPEQAQVGAYTYGELPGQMIGTAGQAAQFGLAGMVSAQNLRATQEGLAAMNDSVREANAARMAATKALAAGRPEQAAKFLQMLQEAQRQQIGLASGLIQQRSAMQNQGFEQGMTKKTFAEQVKQQAIENDQTVIQNQQAWAEIGLKRKALNYSLAEVDVERSVAQKFLVNKKGQFILDKNGKKIPSASLLSQVSGTSKTASMTPGQKSRLVQTAQDYAETAFYGYGKDANGKRVPVSQLGDFDPDNPDTYGSGAQNYNAAQQRLVQMGVKPSMAQQILDGYYERGDMGRPIFNNYEQNIYRKKLGAKKYNWAMQQIKALLDRGEGDAADAMIARVQAGQVQMPTASRSGSGKSSNQAPARARTYIPGLGRQG
jgi:hypothetical protein